MPILAAYSTFVFMVLAACVVMWCWIALRWWNGQPLIPAEPGPLVPWGLADCFLFFVLFVMMAIVASSTVAMVRTSTAQLAVPSPVEPAPSLEPASPAVQTDDSETERGTSAEESTEQGSEANREETKPAGPAIPAMSLADARLLVALDSGLKIVVALLLIGAMTVRYQPTAVEWGWTTAHWRSDVRTGTGVFLATFLPVMVLQAALVYGFDWKYAHPLIELAKQGRDPVFFGLAAFAAAILAPLFEEFIFRGLFQGWLEKLFSGQASAEQILLGGRSSLLSPSQSLPSNHSLSPNQSEHDSVSTTAILASRTQAADNPYLSPIPVVDEPANDDRANDEPLSPELQPRKSLQLLPIVISSMVFSLMHYSHGPAWIPLLLLGAGLGYAYQRTRRLWPGIVAHCLLNSFTMVGLWIQVFGAPEMIKQ
jgi:membrane protease YdiL (CAAX protease family)